MFHLNIRSIPEHFIELTSYIHSLNIAFKIIGTSETAFNDKHAYIKRNFCKVNSQRMSYGITFIIPVRRKLLPSSND